jgi:spore photoproduct lyase
MWKPQEIIIHDDVKTDPVTTYFLSQCPNVSVSYISSSQPNKVKKASNLLKQCGTKMLDKILEAKKVVFISPATPNVVDEFTMPDSRMKCPHFHRLKLAANGCFYQCDWCYLKLTYRAAFPFITVRAEYDKIKGFLSKKISSSNTPIIFNNGELADSLSMEHLTRAGQEFIPWFGQTQNGYLFMLTKSDNVDQILTLPHNGHTIIAWSMNNSDVSRKFEIGAPSFDRRLEAAYKAQQAGYPVRVRLDPIVPFDGWQDAYADTIKNIFQKISPQKITIGTLRFEKGFYDMRNTIFTTGEGLASYVKKMKPMFPRLMVAGSKKPKVGKYSFDENDRVDIFRYVVDEIKKFSDCPIALCKESANVWNAVGLDLSKCECACQLDSVSMQ